MILVGTVCHPPSSFREIKQRLLQHIQEYVQLFLRDHPEDLVLVCGCLIHHFPYNRTSCEAYD